MKSPWRFLADLTSGRKSSPEQLRLPAAEPVSENHSTVANDRVEPAEAATQSSEHEVHDAGTAVVTELELALPEPERVAVKDVPATAQEEVAAEVLPETVESSEAPNVATQSVGPEKGAPAQKASTRRPKRVKESLELAAVQTATEKSEPEQAPPMPSQPLTFHDEVSGLDGEIAALKAALAQKLKLQNAQLRQMLARFDVS